MAKTKFERAEEEPLYLHDGLDYVRTEPTPNGRYRYRGFIKTTQGEKEMSISAKPIFEGLLGGKEITKEEYDAHSFECKHSWRTAWLKNSKTTRKITYCVICSTIKSED